MLKFKLVFVCILPVCILAGWPWGHTVALDTENVLAKVSNGVSQELSVI